MLFLVVIFIFVTCGKDNSMVTNPDKDEEETDITTGATPNGGDLKPAEEGPVRSAFGQPVFALDTFKLEITGLVDSSFSLSWEAIQKSPAVYTDTLIMYCIEGWEVWGVWKGILVKDLLEKAHVYPHAEYILFESIDGYKSTMSLSYVKKYKAMLAYAVNGSPLQNHDGFPLRLIAFGKFGYKWAKWVHRIELMSPMDLSNTLDDEWLDPGDIPVEHRRYYEGEDVEPLVY